MPQGPPNPGFMQEKVQKGYFLKKDSRESKIFSCFRFLWISLRPGTLNWERVVFLQSKNLYRKCVSWVLWKILKKWNQTKTWYLLTLFILVWFTHQKRRGKLKLGKIMSTKVCQSFLYSIPSLDVPMNLTTYRYL